MRGRTAVDPTAIISDADDGDRVVAARRGVEASRVVPVAVTSLTFESRVPIVRAAAIVGLVGESKD